MNSQGRVLSYISTRPVTTDYSSSLSENQIKKLIFTLQRGQFTDKVGLGDENALVTTSDYLLSQMTNSTAHYDRSKPVPDLKMLIAFIDKIFRLLFVNM